MKVLSKFILAVLIMGLLLPAPLRATTYFVAPTGSNSNPGTTVGLPFLTIQKCLNVVLAGDTCTVADGSYPQGLSTVTSGTSVAPITVQSTNKWGAQIVIPSAPNAFNVGINLGHSWYIIDGFDLTGGNGTGANVTNAGIGVYGGTGNIVRNNRLHDIARAVCSDSGFGFEAIYSEDVSTLTIEDNLVFTVGRLMNGESGCSTIRHGNDHGIYIHGGSNMTIRRNVIYDSNRGWPIQVFGGPASNVNIYNNTLADHNFNGFNAGQIILASTITNANVTNNICYDPLPGFGCVNVADSPPTATNVVVDYNLSSTGINYGTRAGVTFGGHNIVNTSPGFTNVAARDYTLAPSSPAIDTGLNVGLSFLGLGPDMGYSESGAATPPGQPLNFGLRFGRSGAR